MTQPHPVSQPHPVTRGEPAADAVRGVATLLAPGNVAILGARDRPGGWADRIRANLHRFGYPGRVFAVNPRHEQLWGEPCYPDLAALPEPPDHVVVLLPAPAALRALRGAPSAGARSATVFSGGFSTDPRGSAPLGELAELSGDTGLVVSGPNCLGNISVPASLVTTTDSRLMALRDGPVAVVGQSGGIVTSLTRVLVGRGIGIRYMVSSGNETCLSTADYLRFFAGADGVRVVLAFVESIRDRDAFFAACARVHAAGRHVVALKIGQSDRGRLAAASHTGALAGSYAAFAAVAEQAGVVCVDSMDLAIEACEYLARARPPGGRGIAAVTVSGGVRELLLDAAVRTGATLPRFTDTTRARLTEVLGEDTDVDNPLDTGYAGLSDPAKLVRCAQIAAEDPGVDAVLLQEELVGRPEAGKERTLGVFDESFPGGSVSGSAVPLALFSMASFGLTDHSRSLHERYPNLAFLQSTDKALAALTAIGNAHSGALRAAAAPPDPGEQPAWRPPPGAGALSEPEAKRVLRAHGVHTAREVVAHTPADAEPAAAELRAPYVVKLVSSTIVHKSDVGGVVVGLADPSAVRAACARIGARHQVDGFLVAEQVPAGVELIVGTQWDPEVGPVVLVGSGGVGVELYQDVAFAPAPCTPETALAALRRTRVSALLDGWRGAPPADVDAVLDTMCALGRLAAGVGQRLESAEINPLVVGPAGTGALALDALIVYREGRAGA